MSDQAAADALCVRATGERLTPRAGEGPGADAPSGAAPADKEQASDTGKESADESSSSNNKDKHRIRRSREGDGEGVFEFESSSSTLDDMSDTATDESSLQDDGQSPTKKVSYASDFDSSCGNRTEDESDPENDHPDDDDDDDDDHAEQDVEDGYSSSPGGHTLEKRLKHKSHKHAKKKPKDLLAAALEDTRRLLAENRNLQSTDDIEAPQQQHREEDDASDTRATWARLNGQHVLRAVLAAAGSGEVDELAVDLVDLCCSQGRADKQKERERDKLTGSTGNLHAATGNGQAEHSNKPASPFKLRPVEKLRDIALEMGTAQYKASSGELFRSSNVYIAVLSECARLVGRDYLHRLVKPIVRAVLSAKMQLEIDPARLQPDMDQTKNLTQLLQLTESLIDTVVKSAAQLPPFIKQTMIGLQKALDGLDGTVIIGSFLFLRFICPAIVLPERYGIIKNKDKICPRTRRTLVLITKMVQGVANNTTESVDKDPKESYLIATRPYMRAFISRLETFASAVLDPMAEGEGKATASKAMRKEKFSGRVTLRWMHENQDKIAEILEKSHGKPEAEAFAHFLETHPMGIVLASTLDSKKARRERREQRRIRRKAAEEQRQSEGKHAKNKSQQSLIDECDPHHAGNSILSSSPRSLWKAGKAMLWDSPGLPKTPRTMRRMLGGDADNVRAKDNGYGWSYDSDGSDVAEQVLSEDENDWESERKRILASGGRQRKGSFNSVVRPFPSSKSDPTGLVSTEKGKQENKEKERTSSSGGARHFVPSFLRREKNKNAEKAQQQLGKDKEETSSQTEKQNTGLRESEENSSTPARGRKRAYSEKSAKPFVDKVQKECATGADKHDAGDADEQQRRQEEIERQKRRAEPKPAPKRSLSDRLLQVKRHSANHIKREAIFEQGGDNSNGDDNNDGAKKEGGAGKAKKQEKRSNSSRKSNPNNKKAKQPRKRSGPQLLFL